MSEIEPVRCKSCGGAVAARVGALPACIFCGSDASHLIPFEPEEGMETPEGLIPFKVDEAGAREAFEQFADSSMWYPSDLNDVNVRLSKVMLPAWLWAGRVETHWTGLVRARGTQSGKRPIGGAEAMTFDQILVPASTTLSLAELSRLGRFDESNQQALQGGEVGEAYELMEMTRSAARQAAQDSMRAKHRGVLSSREQTTELHTASVCLELTGRPILVPVYIGAYRYKDHLYRLLIHGETGELIGNAPTSWIKVSLAILAGLFFSTLAGVCSGGLFWFSGS